MNEKSNPMSMMYKTIPAVAELNKVPGFDPLKFLRHKVSRKTNEEMLQLELPYQKLWFRLRHPQGRMKLTTLRITEQLAIMEARVYLDRSDAEPISSYISQHSAEEGTDYVQAAQDEALSAALSDAGFGLQFADVAVDSTGKVFGSSIPLSGTAPIRQPMPNAAQRPVEAPGAALRQSGGEVHARPERAPQNAVEGRNTPARPAPIQKPAAKPVQNEQSPVSPVQPVVQQMVAEEKENMDTLPAGKVEENGPKRYAIPETWYKQSGTSGTPELQSILRGPLLLHSASALSGRTERSADSLRLLPSGTPHRMPAGSLDKVNRCSG